MKKLKVLICGGREWTNELLIAGRLLKLSEKFEVIVVHGNSRGADRIADARAHALGLERRSYPADWDKHGRAAGMIRNQEMLNKENPDLVIGFHDNIKESKGTENMLRHAYEAGKIIELIDGNGRVFLKGRR